MTTIKLNRSILRQEFKKLGLTKSQRVFYNINGNSSNIVLKQFLDNYKSPKNVNEYNVLRIEARKLGYDEKNGRKKDQLISFIRTKSSEKVLEELTKFKIGALKNEARKLSKPSEQEDVSKMGKKELIEFIKRKNREKSLKSLISINQITINKLINENKFQELFNFIFSGRADTWMNEVQFNTLWNKLIGEKYVLTLNEYKGYSEWDMNKEKDVPVIQNYSMPINDKTYSFLRRLLLERGIVDTIQKHGSDRLDTIVINDVKNVLITKMKKPKRLLQKDDGYFDYINTTELNLSRYQIYTQEQAYDNENFNNCVINCFVLSGVKECLINQIKLSYVSGANIRNKDLPQMSKIIMRNIHIYTIDNSGKVRIQKIDNGFPDVIKISSYKNHAFLYEDSIYTRLL